DCRKKSAEMEAEKAAEYMRKRQAAEAEKKDLLDRLAKPSGVGDEERMKPAVSRTGFAPTRDGRSTRWSQAGKTRSRDCRRSCICSGSSISNRAAIA